MSLSCGWFLAALGMGTVTTLPTIADELARKFRLSDKPNLNEYAYRAIYPGQTSHVGQTTALYYGEGVAYFGHGVLWTLFAPFAFLAAWLAFDRYKLDVGGILSVGIWRSSFSGLIAVAPAVVLQLAGMALLFLFSRILRASDLFGRRVSFIISCLLVTVSTGAAALQIMTLKEVYQRETIAQVTVSSPTGCEFMIGRAPDIQDIIDRNVMQLGYNARSVMTISSAQMVGFLVPYSDVVKKQMNSVIDGLDALVRCRNSQAIESLTFDPSVRTTMAGGTIPLRILAFAYLLLLSVTVVRFEAASISQIRAWFLTRFRGGFARSAPGLKRGE